MKKLIAACVLTGLAIGCQGTATPSKAKTPAVTPNAGDKKPAEHKPDDKKPAENKPNAS